MLDVKLIREKRVKVEQALFKRMKPGSFDLNIIIKLDDKRKELINRSESLKAKRRQNSKVKPSTEIISSLKNIGDEIKKIDTHLSQVEDDLKKHLSALPNLPDEDILAGGKEHNQVVYTYGEQPRFDFNFKDHIFLAEELNMIDYDRAVKISGSGFWAYHNWGALLEWALLSYFIEYHQQNGYTFIIPPFLLNEESAYSTGQLPKFGDDLFWTQDKLCLNATSEMMLGNYHRGEILPVSQLPLKYFAYSPCFRREAGSYRQSERGMVRGHQFNKVEMFVLCKSEDSSIIFDELLEHAQALLSGLNLHYQVSKLAAGDCSAAMSRTYDLEVWLPSMNIYKEVSSVSKSLDYQARRGQIRYKNEQGDNVFVHTLNGSGLATSRLLPAILEQNQRADHSVQIPSILRKYLPGNPKYFYPDQNKF